MAGARPMIILALLALSTVAVNGQIFFNKDTFPGALEGRVSCKLSGDNVVTSSLKTGDPNAYGNAILRLYSLNGQYNIRMDYSLTQFTGINAPLNQSIWQGPVDTEGTLTASFDGVWISGSNGDGSSTSSKSAVKSESGMKTVKKTSGTTGKSGLKNSHHSRRALLWVGEDAAAGGEAGIEQPMAGSGYTVHRRQLKKHKHRKSSSSSSSSSSAPIRSDVQLTSWTIGLAESSDAVALVKNIIASPALYFAQVQTIRYPNGAARCNFKSGIVNQFLNWLNKN